MIKPQKNTRRRIWLLSLLGVFLLLLVLYLGIFLPYFNTTDPETPTPAPKPDPGEDVSGNTLLLYPHADRAVMARIEVWNRYDAASGQYAHYTVLRDTEDKNGDGFTDDFYIDGHVGNTLDDEKFASLVVDVGHTSCLSRLDLVIPDDEAGAAAVYAGYGLREEDHPTYYVLTLTDGTVYTVYIGAKSPDGNYYARVAGRAAVYVLYSSLENSVLAPATRFVVPTLTPEAESKYSYAYIHNFALFRDRSLIEMFFGSGTGTPPDIGTLDPYLMFTYLPTAQRDPLHASAVYGMLAPTGNYVLNDTLADRALSAMPSLEGAEVLKLGLDDTDFAEGGLLANTAYTVFYEMPYAMTFDSAGDPEVGYFMRVVLFITPADADGYYTVGGLSYIPGKESGVFLNMVARVARDKLSFVEASVYDWVDSEIIGASINDVASIAVSSEWGKRIFRIDGDNLNTQTVTETLTGYTWKRYEKGTPFAVNERGYCDNIAQFREWYKMLILMDYEGETAADSGMTAEDIAAVMADDSNCLATLTLTMEDGRTFTYRFYPYSERHCMVSVSGGGAPESTAFYTLTSVVRRLLRAAEDLMTGVEINADYRY